MFESLTDRFEGILTRLRNRGRLTEADVDEVLREIRTALLEADVEISVVRGFTEAVRRRCIGLELSQALSPGQQVVKIVNEELVAILGGETLRITYAGRPPTVVLLAGLQGSGKTTTSAKLARWFKQQGRNPLLVGADLQRPAAVDQLQVLGSQAGISVFSEPSDPVAVATAGVEEARRLGRDVVVVDTAGRLAIDEDLMDEIRRISDAVDPHYTFLVIDAMTGQDAVSTAAAFHQALALDGVILTKLDGDARGGAALSVKEVVGRPIAFASTGEKLDDFDQFHPDRMADRILGMGDMLSLIEQAERSMDQDVATKGAAAMLEGRFTLEDFLEQLQQVRKMGSVSGIFSMLPGMPKDLKEASASVDDSQIDQVEAIIHSMTPAERVDPAIIDGSRRVRIANGSGTATSDVNALLKQFKEMRKMMKGLGRSSGKGGMAGALGGLGGLLGRGPKLPPGALDELAEVGAAGDMAGFPGAAGMAGVSGPMGGGAMAGPGVRNGGATRGSSKSRGKGKKKGKGGGRVTPKAR
ncbi:MAG TPA: signal recognition particle protein [Acidimicrobiales bacterium]|jgi:signal recognition particle subunit SRP54|nr:signal recognition particle protein [Acidimicrobiales bacterium]